MVVNSRYKFVFVHIPKTAGKSVSTVLRELPGDRPAWTARTKHETLYEFRQRVRARQTRVEWLLQANPARYFSFAFVRNPWDRMASLYRYLVESRPREEIAGVESFDDFLERAKDGEPWIMSLHSMRLQKDFCCSPDGAWLADWVGHYESLGRDMEVIQKSVGIKVNLGWVNRSSNSAGEYSNKYTTSGIRVVERLFGEDVELFRYKFSDRADR